jgi:hypothetical protein
MGLKILVFPLRTLHGSLTGQQYSFASWRSKKNGNPHLHLLVDVYLRKEWLARSWKAVGGGYTDIRFVDLHRVAAYLSKYMTKEWLEDFPRTCRRITASKGLVIFGREKSPGEWRLFRQHINWFHDIALLRECGIEVEEFENADGRAQLVYFVAGVALEWSSSRFARTNKWREEAFLRRTGRRTRPSALHFSEQIAKRQIRAEAIICETD